MLTTRKGYNSETREDFVAVQNEKGHGCDVYASGEIIDWEDGNGLIAHADATEVEIRTAVKG